MFLGIIFATLFSFCLYIIFAIGLIIKAGTQKKRTLKYSVIVLIVMLIAFSVLNYSMMIPVTLTNMTITNLIVALIGIFLIYGLVAVKSVHRVGKRFETDMDKGTNNRYFKMMGISGGLIIIAIPIIAIFGIVALGQTYDSIPKKAVDEAKPMDKDQTPITVSPEFARNKIQKSMSQVPNTQFYDLGKLQVQKIKDEIVFVAPVEFTGFWKYFRGKETEGYFRISATNVNAQPEFVESKMKFTNSSYLNDRIERKIYSAFPTYIQSGSAQIEVDEAGKPWYVQTIYRPIGYSSKPDMKHLHVAVIDPVTGEANKYKAADAPEFINGSISSEMASDENTYFGKYVNGWLNSMFGKKDVKIPNESGTESNVTPIFDEQGEMYYFTDMASPKENIDSALGYTLIHARTGKLTYYNGKKNNGIMDSKGAKEIVNKEFPEKKWTGTMPILYNVDGNPTWVVNVLDPNGLFKKYAYIKANDADFVVFGDHAKETLESYRLQLAQDPSNVGATEESDMQKRKGIIERVIVTTQKNGQVIQFLLKNDKTIYSVNAGNSPLALFLMQGDEVEFEANIRENNVGVVDELNIKGLSEDQAPREQGAES